MSNVRLIATGGAITMLITIVVLVFRIDSLASQRDAAAAERNHALAESQQRQQIIDGLNSNIEKLTQQQRDSGREQAGLRAMASEARQRAEDLQHENEAIRRWASDLLPDGIAGLYEHGPLTGAAGYRQYLRDTRAVHATGGKTKGKR